MEQGELVMKQFILAGCAVMLLSIASAQAGPCNTKDKDAGSGPTPGYTGQTTGSTSTAAPRPTEAQQHPPTETMNRVTGEKAASSQDTQRQMQGQPTAAQEAMGAKPPAKTADEGC
jgi:hypothetical protein